MEEKFTLDDKITGNISFIRNDVRNKRKLKCFSIYEPKSFKSIFIRSRNYNNDIDGLLIEHKNWYDTSSNIQFDPRLYIIVRGFDNILYAVSYKDYKRIDQINSFERNAMNSEFVDTKIILAEPLIDDYVCAKVENIISLIGPYDPLNLYHVDHNSIDETDDSITYGIDTNSLIILKYMIGINNLRKQGIKKIVIGADDKTMELFNIFGINMYFEHSKDSSFVPKNVLSYNSSEDDFIICNYNLAKEYEKDGYHVLLVSKKKEDNESIIKRRLDAIDRQGFTR